MIFKYYGFFLFVLRLSSCGTEGSVNEPVEISNPSNSFTSKWRFTAGEVFALPLKPSFTDLNCIP